MASQLWQRIRAARMAAGLTQQEIATPCGVTRVAVGHWESPDETRRTEPDRRKLAIIASLTGAPIEWLQSDDADLNPHWSADMGPKRLNDDYIEVPVVDDRIPQLVKELRANPHQKAAECAAVVGCEVAANIVVSNAWLALHGESCEPRLFAFSMADAAMAPFIQKGDLVVVNPDIGAAHGELIAVANAPDSATGISVRRLKVMSFADGELILHGDPDNDDFLSLPLYAGEVTRNSVSRTALDADDILGRAVQVRRLLF